MQRGVFRRYDIRSGYVGSTSSHVIAGYDINQPYPTADSKSSVHRAVRTRTWVTFY